MERIQEQSVEPVEAPLQEQIGDIPVPPIVEETVDLVPVLPHEHLLPVMEYIAPTSPVNDSLPEPGPAELSALESLHNVIHEKQMEVDRCVRVRWRENDRLRLLEECSSAPPRDLAELRRAIQAGQDALAVVMCDWHAFREQSGLRLKREADVETAQRAELLREEEVAAPKTKKNPKKGNVRDVDVRCQVARTCSKRFYDTI